MTIKELIQILKSFSPDDDIDDIVFEHKGNKYAIVLAVHPKIVLGKPYTEKEWSGPPLRVGPAQPNQPDFFPYDPEDKDS